MGRGERGYVHLIGKTMVHEDHRERPQGKKYRSVQLIVRIEREQGETK